MEDINNVAVEVKNGEMDEEEIIAYIKYLEKKFPDETLKSLSIKIDGDEVDLDYTFGFWKNPSNHWIFSRYFRSVQWC